MNPLDDSTVGDLPSEKRRKLPPWWRWNVVTLAGSMFVLLWARELTRMSPGMTGLTLLSIFFAWYLIPSLITSEKPWPFSIDPGLPPRGGYTLRRRRTSSLRRWAAVCRFAGLLTLIASLLATWSLVEFVYARVGRLLRSDLLFFLLEHAWPIAGGFAAAIALFTLAALASDADERRRHQR